MPTEDETSLLKKKKNAWQNGDNQVSSVMGKKSMGSEGVI